MTEPTRTLVLESHDHGPNLGSADQPPSAPHLPSAVAERFQSIRTASTRVTADASGDPILLQGLVAVDQRYQLLGKFAEGGQGEISTARDRVLDRFVAVKSLKAEHVDNQGVVARFVAEAKVTAQLDHPAIVPLYELNGGQDRRLHIAMKLVMGQTLRELIDDAVLDCRSQQATRSTRVELRALKGRLEHFVKVCDALSFAHSKGVIHRDLKPENVMIGQFHEVYVMDWGIAEVLPETPAPASAPGSVISGTPGYLAPEIIAGSAPLAPAADQYALGMILFELATLKPGMRGGGMAEMFNRTVRGELEPLHHRLPHCRIPADLKAVIHRATALTPAHRYASIAALAEDVRRILQDDETAARPDNLPRKVLRWLVLHRAFAVGMVLAILAVLAGGAGLGVVRHQQAIIALRQRQLTQVFLQSEAARRAHRIDRHLLGAAAILERFSDELRFLLAGRGPTEAPVQIVDARQFREADSAPPETQFSPYYRQLVSLAVANVQLAPEVDELAVAAKIQALNPMIDDLLPLMAAADPESPPRSREVLVQQVLTAGLPVAWLYVGLAEGVLIGYPGSGFIADDYDPRQRPWYRNAENAAGVVWSVPYVDASGLDVVMSASRALRDSHGQLLGVASLDLTFTAIIAVLAAETGGSPVLRRYLVDRDARVMLQSEVTSAQVAQARQNFSTLTFDPFPYPQLAAHLTQAAGGQFEAGPDHQRRLIAYAPVASMGWYLVEEIDLPAFLAWTATQNRRP